MLTSHATRVFSRVRLRALTPPCLSPAARGQPCRPRLPSDTSWVSAALPRGDPVWVALVPRGQGNPAAGGRARQSEGNTRSLGNSLASRCPTPCSGRAKQSKTVSLLPVNCLVSVKSLQQRSQLLSCPTSLLSAQNTATLKYPSHLLFVPKIHIIPGLIEDVCAGMGSGCAPCPRSSC